jgi:chromate transporter
LALAGFVALTVWKAAPWIVVGLSALGGTALALIG